jgi:hypothetical protein
MLIPISTDFYRLSMPRPAGYKWAVLYGDVAIQHSLGKHRSGDTREAFALPSITSIELITATKFGAGKT